MNSVELDEAMDKIESNLLEFFKGDEEMAFEWFNHKTPFLGYTSPAILFASGKHQEIVDLTTTILASKGKI